MRQATLLVATALFGVLGISGYAQEVYAPGNGITAPRLISHVRAVSDYAAEVLLRCVVESSGSPSNIEVVRSTDQRVDSAAVAALRQWKFEPGTKDGAPVAVRVDVEMIVRP